MNNKPEILAPAGGVQQLIAAVRAGADAVYFGATRFNARANAENFQPEDFRRAVEYCHIHGVKAYITLNTLVRDSELSDVAEEIKFIAQCGADAIIIQDLAVADIVKDICPDMSLHASTQMTIHNVSGARFAENFGFSRIVPARELSAKEIGLLSQCTDCEIEVFVHGAMCMSVSGSCYLSAMLGGRSGNRGRCAQPCRLNFNARGREYALSLKDMSYIGDMNLLREAGADSLKIEGRMKRPEYVAAVTDACFKARNGEEYDIDTLQSVFSRSGFTDGYLKSRINLDMFGYRTKDDVLAAGSVLNKLSGLYRKERQTVACDMTFTVNGDGEMRLSVTDADGNTAECVSEGAVTAENRPLDSDYVRRAMEKTGDTPYYLGELKVHNPDSMMCRMSELNALRREVLCRLDEIRKNNHSYEIRDYQMMDLPAHKTTEKKVRLRFENIAQYFENDADEILLPLVDVLSHSEIVEKLGDRLIAEIPSLVFAADEERIIAQAEKLKEMGVKNVLVENAGMLKFCRDMGFCIHGGHGLNIFNSLSADIYGREGLFDATVSFELSAKEIENLRGEIPRGVLVYGYLPLMQFRSCPMKTKNGCGGCNGLTQLTDRYGTAFNVLCRNKKYSILLNSVPLDVTGKNITNIDFVTLYFTVESRDECRRIYENYKAGKSCNEKHTNGLYFRELL